MQAEKPSVAEQIATITGLKLWKVRLVFSKNPLNLHRVSDDEMAIILHAAADLGYENKGRGADGKGKKLKDVTLEMVAKRAGVSENTVRSAFKKDGQISKETRKHVLKIANTLGYKPTHEMKVKDFYSAKKEI